MKHLRNIIRLKIQSILLVLLMIVLCFGCTTQSETKTNIKPENLVTLTFTDYGTYDSHIISVNSNYELIYEIGTLEVYIDNNIDTLNYIKKDSIYPSEKRKLTPIEIEQFNYFYSRQDSLHYQYPYEVLDASTLNLFIKNKGLIRFQT